ncbi:MAG: hypothetical protein ACTSPQ_09395 [Candidatus Helarchaeota archaeon]
MNRFLPLIPDSCLFNLRNVFDNVSEMVLGILEVSSKSDYSPHIYQDVMTILFALVIKFYFRKY